MMELEVPQDEAIPADIIRKIDIESEPIEDVYDTDTLKMKCKMKRVKRILNFNLVKWRCMWLGDIQRAILLSF